MNYTRKPKLETRQAASSGHGFSRAENKGARSATSEGARGNPLRVSPPSLPSSLDGAWIEIFRAGLPAEMPSQESLCS